MTDTWGVKHCIIIIITATDRMLKIKKKSAFANEMITLKSGSICFVY